tara:strand:+ start:913 stop:1080 length:168 start_codon:yes stop_codon:yes gene_type:complete
MKKWKYYSKSDENQETIGIVDAIDENSAYMLASQNKQLSITNFKKIFLVKIINNG